MKKALLTGATGGLGKALAHKLSQEGYFLILVGRHLEELQKLQIARSQIFVAELQERKTLIDLIWKEKPDLIINNAGFGLYGKAIDLSTEDQLLILEVNAKALMEITIESAKMLDHEKKEGMIFNISSLAAEIPTPLMASYGASKAFVSHFSQSLDFELRSKQIRVLFCSPGQFSSDFASKAARRKIVSSKMISFSAEKLANLIYRQIQKKKQAAIYDFRYRLVAFFQHFIPKAWVAKSIEKSLKKRI